MVNDIIFSYEGEKQTENDTERKQHFLQHKENHSNNKEVYIDRSRSTGRKVGFSEVFEDITRRGTLPKDASIHSNKNNNERDAKREDMR